MLGKLVKYDFKWINKVMLIYYTIALILTITTKFVENILNTEQTMIIVIIDKILVGMLISCFFSIIVTCIMRIWARFSKNIYGDESYLIHTLPVSKGKIFNAKILASIATIIISILVIISSLAIVYLNADTVDYIKDIFKSLTDIFEKNGTIGMIVAAILLVISELVFIMFSGIFGMIVGNKANNRKVLKSVLVGIMTYGFLSGFLLIITYILAQFNPTVMELYKTELPSPDSIKLIFYIGLAVYTIYNIGYYLACKKLLEQGVNVD